MTEPLPPLVVFLHGPLGRPSDFDGLLGRLPERFPALAPCLPHGRAGAESPRELADRLAEGLHDETRPVVLVASADAGCVALEFTRRHRRRARGLVLSGCSDDPRDGFRSVDAPVLLLWGTEDAVTPPAVGRRLRAALPDARLLFILEAGHLPMVDRPSVFAFHLSSFLNDLAPESLPPRRLVDEAA
ncbi:MAG: alpha/beta fold hydrolase [Thermoanaerobaculia bacterium]